MNSAPKLLELFSGSHERVGFILDSEEIIECQNISTDPENSFKVSADDIIKYADGAIATWHTHPGATNNLSVNDYDMFLSWPHLRHFIIGTDGVREYVVKDGDVLIA